MLDPNPEVRGGGEKELRKHGINTTRGILENEARKLNAAFIKNSATGLPFVTLKMARTADGRFITHKGEPRWISGPMARVFVHHLRDKVDAVMVGIGTVLADDPQLTTRLGRNKIGHNPLRVVIDEELDIPLTAKVLHDKNAMVVCGRSMANTKKKKQLETKNKIEVFVAPYSKKNIRKITGLPPLELTAVLRHLADKGINHVLCEGGPRLAASLLESGLVDELFLFEAPERKRKKNQKSKKPELSEPELRLNRAIFRQMKPVSTQKIGADHLMLFSKKPGQI
jgi:diaminohydroxyphosphoribosylaminopyrimidine deaminase/5-amino-6-(5-phosphoribosylamino)uracil reductase